MGYAEDQKFKHDYGMTREEFHRLFLAREADIRAGREKDLANATVDIPIGNYNEALRILREWAAKPDWVDGREEAEQVIRLLKG
jgi:Flp pilus assembly protein TadD